MFIISHHLILRNLLFCVAMELQNQEPKPRVVMLPALGMGHLIPFVEFAKRLAVYHGFSITFLTIQWRVSSRQIAYTKSLMSSGLDIQFVELPEVDLQDDEDMKVETLISKLIEKSKPSVEDALRRLQNSSSAICAFIIDFFCTTMLDLGADFHIPTYILFTSTASLLGLMLYFPKLDSELQISFKDVDFAVKVPGRPPIPARDLPAPLQDRTDDAFYWFAYHSSRLREAKGILINTFHDLESQSIAALVDGKILSRDEMPKIYTVGPLISSPLFQPEEVSREDKAGCLKWLDGQPASSVVFVSFGSGGTLSAVQIEELALGLEASQQRFLWVVRRPLSSSASSSFFLMKDSDISELLPPGFQSRTKDRGLVVASWAPQIPILSHPSTGGFLSHCGWNSTLESICFGVPMIAWPLFAEQRMNSLFLVNEIQMAIEARAGSDGIVSREEVERVERELMAGEEGIKVRTKAKELKERAEKALGKDGSSHSPLAALAAEWKSVPTVSTNVTAQ